MGQILKDRRILIVEDNVTNLAVYNVLLRKSGAIIIQDFMNADTVRLLSQRLPIDVILMDLMLRNGISGYDLIQQIKAEPQLAGIPVIAVSASDPEIEIPRARASGFAGFIGKPIEPMLFPRQIADCIAGTPVWHSQSTSMETMTWPFKR